MKAWRRQGCDAFAAQIMATLERMQREDAQWADGYVPHPATWLNRGGWDDEPTPAPKPHRAPTADERKLEAIRRSDELFERITGGSREPERGEADREQPEHALPAGLVGGTHGPVRH
jgi:hypothetical protein